MRGPRRLASTQRRAVSHLGGAARHLQKLGTRTMRNVDENFGWMVAQVAMLVLTATGFGALLAIMR